MQSGQFVWPRLTLPVMFSICRDDSKTTEENLGDLSGQFTLADHRPVHEIVLELMKEGYVPSWCTACYRKGELVSRGGGRAEGRSGCSALWLLYGRKVQGSPSKDCASIALPLLQAARGSTS